MSVRMKLSFTSPIQEEKAPTILDTLEQRKEAFKSDEELMKETSNFVSEVIETATNEAARKKRESESEEVGRGSRSKASDTIEGWNNRARGFCNRVLNALFPCFTNNELMSWAPIRYRFSRP